MYLYKYTKAEDPNSIIGDSRNTNFIELLKSKWDILHDKTDVFRYKINKVQERIVAGKYLLQLNPDRGAKRRLPEKIDNVCQPFDENKFNFTKVHPQEILFNLTKEGNESDIHTLIVNVSPISRYHTLMCPSLSKCHPQVVTEDSLIVALEIMFLAQNRDLRIGFNSLCALASVNHLHYHIFMESTTLPVETAKSSNLEGPVYYLQDPAPAFCFEVVSRESVEDDSKQIFKLVAHFLENSIAHNILMTRGNGLKDGGKEVIRVVIWPRKSSSGVKQLTTFNIAVCKLSGWFPIFDKTEYENLKSANIEKELRKWRIDDFDSLCKGVKSLF